MTSPILPAEYYHHLHRAFDETISRINAFKEIDTGGCYDTGLMFGKYLEASKDAADALLPLEALVAGLKLKELINENHPNSHVFQYSSLIFDAIREYIDFKSVEPWMIDSVSDWMDNPNLSPLLSEEATA